MKPASNPKTPADVGSRLPDGEDEDQALPMPHENDQAIGSAGSKPRELMERARRDLEAGQVDTDLHNTPGLDAQRLDELLKPRC